MIGPHRRRPTLPATTVHRRRIGFDHPHDRADHPATAARRGLRPDLVRRRDDDRDGDGADPSSSRLNLFVIKNIAPDIPLREVIWGVVPFVVLMFAAIFLLSVFPGIATGFPDLVMGAVK